MPDDKRVISAEAQLAATAIKALGRDATEVGIGLCIDAAFKAERESYCTALFEAGKFAGEQSGQLERLAGAVSVFAGHPHIADMLDRVLDSNPELRSELDQRLLMCLDALVAAHEDAGGHDGLGTVCPDCQAEQEAERSGENTCGECGAIESKCQCGTYGFSGTKETH